MILPPYSDGAVYFGHIRTPNPSTSGQVTIAIAGHYAVALTIQNKLEPSKYQLLLKNIPTIRTFLEKVIFEMPKY